MAQRIRARAIRRAGELYQLVEKGKTGPKQMEAGAHLQLDRPREQAREAAGMSEHRAKQANAIANIPEAEFEAAVESRTRRQGVIRCGVIRGVIGQAG